MMMMPVPVASRFWAYWDDAPGLVRQSVSPIVSQKSTTTTASSSELRSNWLTFFSVDSGRLLLGFYCCRSSLLLLLGV